MEYYCPRCNHKMNEYEVETLWCTNCNARFGSKADICDPAEAARLERERAETIERCNNMILSTTPSLDGYVIERYIDVISEDVIFKTSAGDAIVNGISNIVDSFSFSAKEISGDSNTMQRAKKYVREKMIMHAAQIGANAIVGIDFETNVATSAMARVSMNGTAVFVRRLQG